MNDVPLFLPYWQNERDASRRQWRQEVNRRRIGDAMNTVRCSGS
jgi:hypothetical protein